MLNLSTSLITIGLSIKGLKKPKKVIKSKGYCDGLHLVFGLGS